MSRSEEFAAGSGGRHHPNVRDYPAERAGGVHGSIVGMMPTHEVFKLREYDRTGPDGDSHSHRVINGLRQDLRAGVGFKEPVVIDYDPREKWASLGEGNHRLAAAMIEGVPEVPVRVNRTYQFEDDIKAGRGRPAQHKPEAEYSPGYVASDFHPSMLQFGDSHEALDVHSEIARMRARLEGGTTR